MTKNKKSPETRRDAINRVSTFIFVGREGFEPP